MARREIERQAAAVGVAGEPHAVELQPVEDGEDEALLAGEGVARRVLRTLGVAETVEIDRHHRELLGERRQDRGIGDRRLPETVEQDERRAFAGPFDGDPLAVDLEQAFQRQTADRFGVGLHGDAAHGRQERHEQQREEGRGAQGHSDSLCAFGRRRGAPVKPVAFRLRPPP